MTTLIIGMKIKLKLGTKRLIYVKKKNVKKGDHLGASLLGS